MLKYFFFLLMSVMVMAQPDPAAASPAWKAQTGDERWQAWRKAAFASPAAWMGSVMPATFGTINETPIEWGQDAEGFARRFGTEMARVQLQQAFFHGGAALLGTESVYRPCDCEGKWRRVGYAVSRTFVSRNRSGRLVPNVAFIGGFYGGALLSARLYPDSISATQFGLRRGHFQIGINTGFNVARELFRKR
jgi:hypothetical protein